MMATELGETKILNIVGQDVCVAKWYYLSSCHTSFKGRYDQTIQNEGDYDKNSLLEDLL